MNQTTSQEKIVAYNLKALNHYSNEIFCVDKTGRLKPISNWHIVGRFVEWVKDFLSGWERSKKVHQTILETLTLVEQSQVIMFNPGRKYPITPVISWFVYTPRWTIQMQSINVLIIKILNSKLAKDPEIFQKTHQLAHQVVPLIEKMGEELRANPSNKFTKRIRILGKGIVNLDFKWQNFPSPSLP